MATSANPAETPAQGPAAVALRSRPIHSGHHQAEQAPDELAVALLQFLGMKS